ncbi:MAG: type II toxin-antitoxin system VapC family toxin [Steroidobacteraceae bacterium]
MVIAAFASWHEHHDRARAALDEGARLIEHCALETYSVLTRLPPPHRSSGEIVRDFLRSRFAEPYLRLDTGAHKEFVLELPERGIAGGASYDALVAATAVAHSADLITCDRKAAPTYESFGVRVVFLA